MEKINFVNGQSPYISATNLNNLQNNVENAINEVNDKIKLDTTIGSIITGILTSASGANVLVSTYVVVGKIIVIGLDLTAVEQISQYQPIAYFNNGGLLGNGYIYTTANETCYLNKDKQSIDIYKSGGLAAGEKVYINTVAILNS